MVLRVFFFFRDIFWIFFRILWKSFHSSSSFIAIISGFLRILLVCKGHSPPPRPPPRLVRAAMVDHSAQENQLDDNEIFNGKREREKKKKKGKKRRRKSFLLTPSLFFGWMNSRVIAVFPIRPAHCLFNRHSNVGLLHSYSSRLPTSLGNSLNGQI